MWEGASELKATVPSTSLHPCSIFQGCHAHRHFTNKNRKHLEIEEFAQGRPAVTPMLVAAGTSENRGPSGPCLGLTASLREPVGTRTGKQAGQVGGPAGKQPESLVVS